MNILAYNTRHKMVHMHSKAVILGWAPARSTVALKTGFSERPFPCAKGGEEVVPPIAVWSCTVDAAASKASLLSNYSIDLL